MPLLVSLHTYSFTPACTPTASDVFDYWNHNKHVESPDQVMAGSKPRAAWQVAVGHQRWTGDGSTVLDAHHRATVCWHECGQKE